MSERGQTIAEIQAGYREEYNMREFPKKEGDRYIELLTDRPFDHIKDPALREKAELNYYRWVTTAVASDLGQWL